MPILPLVDLLILMSTGCLGAAFLLKAVYLTTHYRPAPLGLGPFDWVTLALLLLAFALALAARTWVKLNEPRLAGLRRREARFREDELADVEGLDAPEALDSLPREAAGGERR